MLFEPSTVMTEFVVALPSVSDTMMDPVPPVPLTANEAPVAPVGPPTKSSVVKIRLPFN